MRRPTGKGVLRLAGARSTRRWRPSIACLGAHRPRQIDTQEIGAHADTSAGPTIFYVSVEPDRASATPFLSSA